LKVGNENIKGKKANSFWAGTLVAQISLLLVSSSSSSSIPSILEAQKILEQIG